MDENEKKVSANVPVGEPQALEEGVPTPEGSGNSPEGGSETRIKWATKKERIIAWVLAIIVILITLAYAYSIATGDLFRH